MAFRFGRSRNVAGLLVAAALALPLFDPAMAWFMVPAALGGILMAGALFYVHRTHLFEHLEDATDASDSLKLGMFNLSSVKPAGIGGLGLSVMAVITALNFREGQYLLIFGVLGGLVVAAALVRYRRTHVSTPIHLQLPTSHH